MKVFKVFLERADEAFLTYIVVLFYSVLHFEKQKNNLFLYIDLPPLRVSLFCNVPPYINYIPTQDGRKIFPPAKVGLR